MPHFVHHDVALGAWLTQVDDLAYVSLHSLGVHERRGESRYTTLDGDNLLAAHRLPPACWANASLRTSRAGATRCAGPR